MSTGTSAKKDKKDAKGVAMGVVRNVYAKFKAGVYKEQQRKEKQLLMDGVMEMMDLAAYMYFRGKKKNGGEECQIKLKT